jgi:integrase/recombinase XerD
MIREGLIKYLNKRLTEATAIRYLYHIDLLLLKRPAANRLQYNDIITLVEELRKSGYNGVIKQIISAIKKYYDYLLETGLRNNHPCKQLHIRVQKKPIQIQDLFSSEELAILQNRENRYSDLELRNKVLISLMIYQGLSSAELTRIELRNVNLDEGHIAIQGSKQIEARTLELKPKQILLLQRYIDTERQKLNSQNLRFLLITKFGKQLLTDGIHSIIQYQKPLFPNKILSPETIRQSVISNMLNEYKRPLADVQLFAGHKYPSTTAKYRSKDVEEQRRLINMYHPLKHR